MDFIPLLVQLVMKQLISSKEGGRLLKTDISLKYEEAKYVMKIAVSDKSMHKL